MSMAAIILLYDLRRDGIADSTSHLIISVSNPRTLRRVWMSMAAVILLYALRRDGIADSTSHLIISVSNPHTLRS